VTAERNKARAQDYPEIFALGQEFRVAEGPRSRFQDLNPTMTRSDDCVAQLRKNERGVGIIAALLAVAVVGLLATGLSTMFSGRINERKIDMLIRGREVAYAYLRTNASSPDALFVSSLNAAPGNRALRRCLMRTAANDCTATSPDRAQQFQLLVPFSSQTPGAPVSGSSAGDEGGHYTSNGFRSNCRASRDCPYWGRTYFWAQCPNNAATCQQAVRIYIRPQILTQRNVMDSNSFLPGGSVAIRDQPTQAQITANPKFGVAEVMVSEILQTAQVCPTGSYMTGITATGQILCKCDQGFVQVNVDTATGWPVCQALSRCTPPAVLAGTTANGEAYCRVPPTTSYQCREESTPSSGKVSCQPGERMKAVHAQSECFVIKDVVSCDTMKIKCCKSK
jgi:Flp pilus assembly pilin Flp